ncbi:hypothetical protein B0T20DRAFT_390634 [Sordaria brevicollis]|uniref:Uncharacterized protein n=1 Tax=Sordaria brevicollis TaxID=83679 RepID=A0AAE0UE14_SORBR|nr:hypothetical protein B0T20DRAFT_390634 [Sordaria brevicollis]
MSRSRSCRGCLENAPREAERGEEPVDRQLCFAKMVKMNGHAWLALIALFLLPPSSAKKAPVLDHAMLSTIAGTPSHPPYGIPASDFAHAISAANNNSISNASFPITGYNTSIPAGPDDATGNGITGWHLAIDVAANVPLTHATEIVSATVKKNNVTEVATLSLVPPSVVSLENDSWRICAIVFSGGLSDDTVDGALRNGDKLNGTCDRFLSSACIQQLQVNSVANNTARKGGKGCQGLQVPAACGKSFVVKVGDGYEINSTNVSQLNGNNRYSFFVEASPPTSKDNATVVLAMERIVRPVVITWTHFSTSGEVHDSAGWLSCVKAPDVTNPDWNDSKATNGGGSGKEKSMWALIVALVLTAVMANF